MPRRSLSRSALALALAASACSSSKDSAPTPARLAGKDAAAAAARTPPAPTPAEPLVPPAAPPAAAPPAPAKPAAGGTFLLVHEGVPLDATLILGKLDGEPAVDGDGEAHIAQFPPFYQYYVAGRPLRSAPEAYAAQRGVRLDLHDNAGVVCQVTVGDLVAVRWGTISGETGMTMRGEGNKGRSSWPAAPMWAGSKDVRVWGTYVAARPADPSGPCVGALFAVPRGHELEHTKLVAAAEWEGGGEAVFSAAPTVGLLDEKVAVEGEGEKSHFISARRLGPAAGPSLALLYGTARGDRVIAVARVPSAAIDGGTVLATVFATAPSKVTGVDADGDGAVDAVISYDGGVAVVRAAGSGLVADRGVVREVEP